MRQLLTILALLVGLAITGTVAAHDDPEWHGVANLPPEHTHPMPPDMRAHFDHVMAGLWHEKCQCWKFIYEGEMDTVYPPIPDDVAWDILALIEFREIIPIEPGVTH